MHRRRSTQKHATTPLNTGPPVAIAPGYAIAAAAGTVKFALRAFMPPRTVILGMLSFGVALSVSAQDNSNIPVAANTGAMTAAAAPATSGEEESGADLAKKLNLNIQPVMPFKLNAKVDLIARIVAPIVSQPPVFAGGIGTSGVTDRWNTPVNFMASKLWTFGTS